MQSESDSDIKPFKDNTSGLERTKVAVNEDVSVSLTS